MSWLSKISFPANKELLSGLTYLNEVTNSQHGQLDGYLIAYIPGEAKDSLKPGHRPIAYLQYAIFEQTVSVIHIYVHPDFRRRGVGTFLMNALNKMAKEDNLEIKITATTDEGDQFFNQTRKISSVETNPQTQLTFWKDFPQTETPEFQQWFSGSKAVDSSGNPLRLYHGTTQDFDRFEVGHKGRNSNVFGGWDVQRSGIFFSVDPNVASDFANQTDDFNGPGNTGQHVKPVYLAIFDPIDLRNGFSLAQLNAMKMHGLNPKYYMNVRDMWEIFDYENGGKEFVEVMKKMGYDGAIIEEENTTWVAFDPNQVKSATGNRGSFNQENPNITSSLRLNWLQKIAEQEELIQQIINLSDQKEAEIARRLHQKNIDYTPGQISPQYIQMLHNKTHEQLQQEIEYRTTEMEISIRRAVIYAEENHKANEIKNRIPEELLDEYGDDISIADNGYTRYIWSTKQEIRKEIQKHDGLPMHPCEGTTPPGYFYLHVGERKWVNILQSDYGRSGPVCEVIIQNLPEGFFLVVDPDQTVQGKVDSNLIISKVGLIPAKCIQIAWQKSKQAGEPGFRYDDDFWQTA